MASTSKISVGAGDESNIRTAAEMIKKASQNLKDSYKIASEDCKIKGLIELRVDVFNNAKLYQDKIIPFAILTITDIQEFCNAVDILTYEEFKDYLDELISNSQSSKILCDCALKFNTAILVKFKEMENKAQILQNSSLLHLKNSIENYIYFLSSLSGFFNILFMNINTLKRRAERAKLFHENEISNYYYKLIKFKANEIISFCTDYINLQPLFKIDFDGIEAEPDKYYIDEWIPNEIKKYDIYDDFKKIAKNKLSLRQICGNKLFMSQY